MIRLDNLKNKIFCAPAEKLLAILPDKCVDLALIDPPYGIDYTGQVEHKCTEGKHGWKKYECKDKTWDKDRIAPELIREIIRVSKNQIIWGGNYYADILKPSQGYLVWNKGQRGFSLADGEIAWTSYDKAMRIFDYSRAQFKTDEPYKIHITQKPVKLFEWCLEKAKLRPGALVLDVFCGSATTAIAAYNRGYSFICSDIDAGMITKAKERYEEHIRQIRFLEPEEVTQLTIGSTDNG